MVVRVTPQDLKDVASKLNSGASEIASQLSALKSGVDALVNGQWEGAASASFNNLYAEWNAAGGRLNEALTGIASMLTSTGEQYELTEQELAKRFSQS